MSPWEGETPLVGGNVPSPQGSPSPPRKKPLFPGLTERAFEEPILAGRNILGPYLLVSEPAGVRRILVENAANYPKGDLDKRFFAAIFGGGLLGLDGDAWRRHRRIMAPAFDPRSVAAYAPALQRSSLEFRARWDSLPDGTNVDMVKEMADVTLRVISRTVFSTEDDTIRKLVGGALHKGLEAAASANILDLIPVARDIRMHAREAKMRQATRVLDRAIADLVRQREAEISQAPQDLLSRLVAAKDENGGQGLCAKEIRDEIVTIFMAGHETTANTLCWIWYILSVRPRHRLQLHEELDEVLGDEPPSLQSLERLTFTRRIVEEAMRLYPAAPGLSVRRAVQADEVCGVRVPKGAAVSILPWVLHRHRRLWDDPERFDPDRFSPEKAAERQRFSYLPFGAGPRVCIGQVLAMNETIFLLAALAQRYSPDLAPDASVEPVANITLQMRHGLKMTLRRRRPGSRRPTTAH